VGLDSRGLKLKHTKISFSSSSSRCLKLFRDAFDNVISTHSLGLLKITKTVFSRIWFDWHLQMFDYSNYNYMCNYKA